MVPDLKSYMEYNNPTIGLIRTGKIGDEYVDRADNMPIINNVISLWEIPVDTYGVQIEGFTEINRIIYEDKGELGETEFIVNYSSGVIMFHSTQEGKSLLVRYKGKGFIMLSATRVFAMYKQNPDVIVTLQEIIDQSKAQLALAETRIAKYEEVAQIALAAADKASVAADLAEQAGIFADAATLAANEAAESTIIIYKTPVDKYTDLATTYPNPANGWRVMIESTGDIYRFSTQTMKWVLIDNWTGGALPYASETTAGLLQSDDFSNFISRNITFSIPSIFQTGIQKHIIQYPYDGEITDIRIYCITPPSGSNFSLQVEKISESGFDSGGAWTGILNSELQIKIDENKSSTASLNSTAKIISKNTYFRLNVSSTNSYIGAIGVQIKIKSV